MKKMFLAALLAMICVGANAQFEKGTKFANLSLTGLDMSVQKGQKFHLGLQGEGGYFLAQDWMIGGKLGYDYVGGGPTHMFDLGADFRYYFNRTGVYMSGGLLFQHQGFGGGAVTNWFSFVPEVGYCFYINHYISIEPAVYCNLCFNDFENGSKLGLKVGVGFYF